MTTLLYAGHRPGGGDARARQRRPPAAARRSTRPAPRATSGRSGGVPLGAAATAIYAVRDLPAAHRLDRAHLHRRPRRAPRASRSTSASSGCARVAEGADDVEALCARSSSEIVPEAPGDDVAFIAARVPPLTRPPDDALGRDAARASPRSATCCAAGCSARGATEDEAFDIIVAAQEACANAIEHAYGPGRAEFELEARYADGRVTHHGRRPRPLAAAARPATAAAGCRSCAS